MTANGHWLEAAVIASARAYQTRGVACIQKIATPAGQTKDGRFYRERSTVDFVGVYMGAPVAFDAKVTQKPYLQHYNVHDHQLEFLRAFTKAKGIGALLVAFENQGIGGSFFVHVDWYDDVKDELASRSSIPLSRFVTAAERDDERCFRVTHGQHGLAVPFADALDKIIGARRDA